MNTFLETLEISSTKLMKSVKHQLKWTFKERWETNVDKK